MVIYLAYSMQKKKDKLKDFKVGFLPHVLVLGMFTALIIVQPDFGSVAILCALTWIMLFVGGVRITHLLAASVIILPLAYLLLIDAEYRLNRMMSFWNPWKYSANEGYQIVHSLMAFGTGGETVLSSRASHRFYLFGHRRRVGSFGSSGYPWTLCTDFLAGDLHFQKQSRFFWFIRRHGTHNCDRAPGLY
jgi:cell division protein FtsW (lipid II flippase)